MRKARIFIVAVVAAFIALPGGIAGAQTGDAQVFVVHGVPDLEVDVYVNDGLTLESFMFGEVAGPLSLPAGTYQIDIYAAGSDPASTDPALSGAATLEAGSAATIAAYLTAEGTPTLGAFVEDTSRLDAGEARITARHLAAFGPVDILANDAPLFEGVPNGVGGAADVPAGTYNVKITAAGDPTTVAFDADVTLAEGTNTIAYAIGSVAGGSFQVVTAAIGGLHTPPAGVPSGTGGVAAGPGLFLPVLLAVAAVVLLGTARAVRQDA